MKSETPQGRHTAGEMDDRIQFGRKLLAEGITTKGEWKSRMRKRYRNISARTLERYFSRAREMNREEQEASIEDLVADAIAFYDRVIGDAEQSMQARLRARERKDKLLGLEQVLKVEHSGNLNVVHGGVLGFAELRQEILGRDDIFADDGHPAADGHAGPVRPLGDTRAAPAVDSGPASTSDQPGGGGNDPVG